MTRSAWWNRPLAAVMALWAVLFLGEPSLVHSCPVHDGLAVVATSMAGHGAGHGASHGAAMPMHGAAPAAAVAGDAAHTSGGPAPEHGGGHHACTCPGDCSAGSSTAPALPAAYVTSASATTYRVASAATPVEAGRPRLAAPHALPFANGPPSATAPESRAA